MSIEKQPRSMFSERLRMLRKASNMTQKQVAQNLSIDRSTYAYYEIDKTKPDYETLMRISRIFNVSVDYLLGRERELPSSLPLRDGAPERGGDPPLSQDEQAILGVYRRLDAMQKNAVLQFALEQQYQKRTGRPNSTEK